jgi:hypothetical protein
MTCWSAIFRFRREIKCFVGVAHKANFLSRFKHIAPSGKSVKSCPAPFEKIFCFTFLEIGIINASSHPRGGALAIVTKRWDGMRWTRQHGARRISQGEMNLVSDGRRAGRAMLQRLGQDFGRQQHGLSRDCSRKLRTAKPCGPGIRC